MSVDAFVDTNVLLYAASTRPSEAEKRARARALLAGTDWGLYSEALNNGQDYDGVRVVNPF
jgi:predicted nucleic acid-binding protein